MESACYPWVRGRRGEGGTLMETAAFSDCWPSDASNRQWRMSQICK